MKILNAMMSALVAAALLAAALALGAAAAWPPSGPAILAGIGRHRASAFAVAAVMLLLDAAFALSLWGRRRERFLSFDTEGGVITISTEAIARYLMKLLAEFPSIVRMRPQVVPGRREVDIVLDICVKAGPQIHEICETLQQRARESMTSGLGISQVRQVQVRVSEINAEYKTA